MAIINPLPIELGEQNLDSKYYRTLRDDLILMRYPSLQSCSPSPFKLGKFVFVICLKGHAVGNVNLVRHEIKAPGIFLVRKDQVVQFVEVSPDFKVCMVLASSDFLSKLELRVEGVLPLKFLMSVYESPFIEIDSADMKDIMSFFNLMFRVMHNDNNPYREQSLVNLMRSFCYESGYFLSKNIGDVHTPDLNPFIERLLPLIKDNFIEHKDVTFYAEKMGLSANYLYKIVKGASGKTVTEWIEEYTISEAKSRLRDPKVSIQTISEQLNFPSQSFFGKYFKRVAGMSPKDYRKKILVKS